MPRHLFVSCAAADRPAVRRFLDELQPALQTEAALAGPITFWLAEDALRPGEAWQTQLGDALQSAAGILLFISPAALSSPHACRELQLAVQQGGFILPILLEPTRVPPELADRHCIDASARLDPAARLVMLHRVAQQIDQALRGGPAAPLAPEAARRLARHLAGSLRSEIQATPADDTPPDAVFVVHGHDHDALQAVCDTLGALGVRPVVLSRIAGPAQSLLQKFFQVSREARFAIVLLTADDYGASRRQFESDGVGERALRYRARQNVILELGFFYGHLGWDRVFVLQKAPPRVFPDFERPSDLDGVVFDPIDEGGEWQGILARKLREAGFALTPRP